MLLAVESVLSVMWLSSLGVKISWGLAFSLPWILAYFYLLYGSAPHTSCP